MARRRHVLCLAAALAAVVTLLPAAPASAHQMWCGALAPADNACDNGSHVRAGEISHGPWYDNMTTFTGVLESRLTYPGGARVYRCWILDGVKQGACTRTGSFPPVGATFTQTCATYVYTKPPVVDLSAESLPDVVVPDVVPLTPGGIGSWECIIWSH